LPKPHFFSQQDFSSQQLDFSSQHAGFSSQQGFASQQTGFSSQHGFASQHAGFSSQHTGLASQQLCSSQQAGLHSDLQRFLKRPQPNAFAGDSMLTRMAKTAKPKVKRTTLRFIAVPPKHRKKLTGLTTNPIE